MAKGVWVGKQACTSPDCTSSDGMNLYLQEDGHHDGYCFVCTHYDPDPLSELGCAKDTGTSVSLKLGGELNQSYLSQLEDLPCRAEASRGLKKETMEYFGIRTELSKADGQTIVAHHYPYYKEGKLVAFKTRRLPKEISTVGKFSGSNLFGEDRASLAGRNRLIITEGELDAAAAYQMLKEKSRGTKWESLNPTVVSINSGATSAVKDISRRIDFVKSFKSIILAFDQDEAGLDATKKVAQLLPNVEIATFSEKDANDMLLNNKADEFCKAVLFNTKKYKPQSVVSVDDVFERAIKMPEWGMEWPWPTLHKLTYGIHRKKLYGLGAGVGIGKTDWAKELQSCLVNRHGLPIGACMLEEDVGRTLKGIAGKFCGKPFHKPDGDFTREELIEGISSLRGKVLLFDHNGCKDWEEIKASIRYMVVSEGIKDIFIDPLTALVSHVSSAEANDLLNNIMGDLAGMAHELDFTAYYFCHLNTPDYGPPHERGGKVHESQFTGSRAMMRWSHYLFGLERNKDPDISEDQRNTSHLILLKDREYGNVGKVTLFYNKYTGTFLEP